MGLRLVLVPTDLGLLGEEEQGEVARLGRVLGPDVAPHEEVGLGGQLVAGEEVVEGLGVELGGPAEALRVLRVEPVAERRERGSHRIDLAADGATAAGPQRGAGGELAAEAHDLFAGSRPPLQPHAEALEEGAQGAVVAVDELAPRLHPDALGEGARRVRTRPPRRSRASSTTTSHPASRRSRAAVSPARPAPTTTARRRASPEPAGESPAGAGDPSGPPIVAVDPDRPADPAASGGAEVQAASAATPPATLNPRNRRLD